MSFEAAFLAHMLLPSGERVVDRMEAERLLPGPGTVVEFKKAKEEV